MKNGYLITFRSVTFAQKGERALVRSGMVCTMRRTPRELSVRGCGYCLAVRGDEVAAAVALLQEKQIPFGKIYEITESGRPEERAL